MDDFPSNGSIIMALDDDESRVASGIQFTSEGFYTVDRNGDRRFNIAVEIPKGYHAKIDSFAVVQVTVQGTTMSIAVKVKAFTFDEHLPNSQPYHEGSKYSLTEHRTAPHTSYGRGATREKQCNVALRGAAHLLSKYHRKRTNYLGGEIALLSSLRIEPFAEPVQVDTIRLPKKYSKWSHDNPPKTGSDNSRCAGGHEGGNVTIHEDGSLTFATDHNYRHHSGFYAVDMQACDAAAILGVVSPQNMLFVLICDGVSLLKPVCTLNLKDTLGVVLKTLVCLSSSWPELPNQHLEFYLSGYVDVRMDDKLTKKGRNLLLTLGSQTYRTNYEVVGKSDNKSDKPVRCLHRYDAWEPITPWISKNPNSEDEVCSSPQSGASGDSEDDDDKDTRRTKKSRTAKRESQLGKRSHSKSRSNKTKLDKSGKHHGSRKHKQQLPDSELEDRAESNNPKVQSPKMSGKPTSEDVQEGDVPGALLNEGSQTDSPSEGLTTSSTTAGHELSQQLERMKLEKADNTNDDFTDPQTRRKGTEDTLGDTAQPLDSPRESFIAGYDSHDSGGDDSSAQSGHPASLVKRKGSAAVESPMFVPADSQELVDAPSSALDESSLGMSAKRSSDGKTSQSGTDSQKPRRKSMIGRLANRFSKLLSSSRGSRSESEHCTETVTKESDSLEELKKEDAVYVVGENDDIVQQLKTQLSSSQCNVSITDSLTQATYVLLLVESALFATDEIREALDSFNEHNVQLVILYVSGESRNVESLLAKVPSKYKSLKDVEWIPYHATNKGQDDQHDAIVNALRALDLDDTKVATTQDNSRSDEMPRNVDVIAHSVETGDNEVPQHNVLQTPRIGQSYQTMSHPSPNDANRLLEATSEGEADPQGSYNEAYEQTTAHERRILKQIVPIAQLVGTEDEEAQKRFSVGTWNSLLSPRGVSVAALCILCDEVLKSRRAEGVQLVTLLEDMHDHKGTLVEKGRTIRLTASSKTSTKWKGKSSYAKGGILRFNPSQVSAVKPRAKWTIEDYCEHVVKRDVTDSKTFFQDEFDNKYVGPVGKGYYISHARSCTFVSLCDALLQYFDGQDLSQCFVWLDLFCANLGLLTIGDTSEEVQKHREDVLKHGIHHIIQQMDGGCLLFLDQWRKPAALGGAWVIWELLGVALTDTNFDIALPRYAFQESFDKMLVENIDQVIEAIMGIDVGRATCGNPAVLKYLQAKWNRHEDTVNNFIRNHLRKWFSVVAQQRGQLLLEKQEFNDQTGRLLGAAGRLLQNMGKYRETLPLFERSLAIDEKVHGPDHPLTATGLSNLALLLKDMGKYSEALPLFERSLTINEKVHGPDHPSTSTSLNNLGLVLQDMGKYSEALPLLERSLHIDEKVYGPDHPSTSTALSNLALVFQDMGKYSEALPLFERSLIINEKIHGPDHPSTSTALSNLALSLMAIGKYSEALPLFERSLSIYERVHGTSHPLTATGLNYLGRVLQGMGRYSEALPLFERSLAINEMVHGPDHPSISTALNNLALMLKDMGKYAEALPLFERSLVIEEKVLGPDHPSTSTALSNLALLLMAMGKYSEALPLFERSLAIIEKVHGPDHPSTSTSLNNLASLLQSMGNYNEALPLLERSLATKQKVYGPDHPSTSTGLNNLALVLQEMGKYSEALPLFERSLVIIEKVHGPDHPSTSTSLNNLALVLQNMGKYSEALPLFQRSLEVDEKVYGPDHPSTSTALSNLALVFQDMGKYNEALPLFERSLIINEKVHGPDHPSTSTALSNLALSLMAIGKYSEALPLFERSLSIYERVHGTSHPLTATGLNYLGRVLQGMGRYSEALPLFERSLAINEMVHGPEHPSTSTALSNVALVLQGMGKYAEALPLLERSLEIDEKVHGSDHPYTPIGLNNLGRVLQDMGKYSEALPLFERSLAICEKVYGPDHLKTSTALSNLALVLKDMEKYEEALPLFKRSLAICKQVHGPDHPDSVARLNNLATTLQNMGKFDEAIKLLSPSLASSGHAGELWHSTYKQPSDILTGSTDRTFSQAALLSGDTPFNI